jgi:phosphate transport system substrate-binding protein
VTKNRFGALLGAAVLAATLAACGSSSKSSSTSSSTAAASSSSSGATANGTITGAGSTFAAPVYNEWGTQVHGLTLNYQAVGSGAGITSFESKTVNFGATDPPLAPADIAKTAAQGGAQHLPMFFGAITVAYNVSGLKTGLKLDGATIADIFLGNIKSWNDPKIAALNPGVTLPNTPITVIHRSDSSGTTAGFTSFLAAYSPQWAAKVGTGKDVPWPTGTGAKGNPGVAAAVQQTAGAVGYVEQAYALQHNFAVASVKNESGNYVAPTLSSTTAAAPSAVPPSLIFKTNPKTTNPAAYPITSQTFIVVWKDMCKAGIPESTAKNIVTFLNYGLGAGQSILAQADYAQLPSTLASQAKAAVAKLTCNGSALG